MKHDVPVKNGIVIPEHELEITASRSGGAGGQHVNKTSTRITVRWNVRTTSALTDVQKERVLAKLHNRITGEGDLIIHSSSTRSQQKNKELAVQELADLVRKALYVPKKRIKTRTPQGAQEKRLQSKSRRSDIKKMRSTKWD